MAPSTPVFRTPSDSPYSIEIAGVGVVGGAGKGGIPVARAAERIHELQNENGKPLSGKKLGDAAEAFAEARGLVVDSVRGELDAKAEEKLRVEGGAFPDGLSIEEVSRQASERDRAQVEAHEAPLVVGDVPPQETAILPNPPEEA